MHIPFESRLTEREPVEGGCRFLRPVARSP